MTDRYVAEICSNGVWSIFMSDTSRMYIDGYLTGAVRHTPRSAYRMRDTVKDKVLREWPASDSPAIGMVAGWPTHDQCIRAALKALRQIQPPSSRGSRSRWEDSSPELWAAVQEATALLAPHSNVTP